ncbi:MAG: cytochrome c maturation protein CcmE domain-containing protein [Promethearchaeota archaeon]
MVVNSRPYLQVSQVASSPGRYHNKEVQVIGIVQGFSGGNFNLTENEHSILVDVNSLTLPNDLDNGVKVVVTGVFNSSLIITASQILTQCS